VTNFSASFFLYGNPEIAAVQTFKICSAGENFKERKFIQFGNKGFFAPAPYGMIFCI
jgi:hypothetical protein